ncbi:HmuY family protein [Lunatimonas salinarum]|uniref:HmuY family protein n=1 Tax=Lunatimonas salinarum TaxID=1774590 RepID=UPI001ADF2225|nr:HmuY family protein [Lunatimonas salinarum]
MKKMIASLSSLWFLATLIGCDTNEENQPEIPLEAILVENIHAPNDVIDRSTGDITESRPFRYFSLEDNQLVESESGNWDIGFKGTTIIVNGGISGSGNAQGTVVTGVFDEIDVVPASATFISDGTEGLAIPTGSGNGWYNYNFQTHIVSPIPGRVLLFKTNAGNYAKVEILSYYENNPPLAEVIGLSTPSPYYTFRYILQPNGSKNF